MIIDRNFAQNSGQQPNVSYSTPLVIDFQDSANSNIKHFFFLTGQIRNFSRRIVFFSPCGFGRLSENVRVNWLFVIIHDHGKLVMNSVNRVQKFISIHTFTHIFLNRSLWNPIKYRSHIILSPDPLQCRSFYIINSSTTNTKVGNLKQGLIL